MVTLQHNRRPVRGDAVIRKALALLYERMVKQGVLCNSPGAIENYLRLSLTEREHEVFVVLFLNTQNRLIALEEMFRGALTQTSVHPREVIKAALRHNAASVVFAHNHHRGSTEPSIADRILTTTLSKTLYLVDCEVLDHFIVADGAVLSFREEGIPLRCKNHPAPQTPPRRSRPNKKLQVPAITQSRGERKSSDHNAT